jgi:DNA-directed RNA polymerase specialized sigma24 family protein
MYNSFKEINDDDGRDIEYISRAMTGDLTALEHLVLRHQSWIFNIVVNITKYVASAQDITQEVLIKVITKLSTYHCRGRYEHEWIDRA